MQELDNSKMVKNKQKVTRDSKEKTSNKKEIIDNNPDQILFLL